MKAIYPASLVFLVIASIAPLFAQTNTFPASGNVGIGTASPTTLLTLNQSAGGNMLSFNGAGTNAAYQTFNSAGGTAYFGMEPSSGGTLNIGGAAYALSVVPADTRKLQFGYSGGRGVALTVDTTGNVGIGTTTPQARLDVAGPIVVQSTLTTQGGATSYYGFGEVVGNTLSSSDLDSSRPALGPYGFYRINYHTGLSVSAHSYYGGIRFYNQGYAAGNSNPYDSSTGAVLAMSVVSGNVGVGTGNPNSKLTVGDGAGNQRIAIDGAATGQVDLAFRKASAVKWLEYMGANSNDLTFNDGVDRVTFQSGGNVGIGTTNPTQKLSVNGTIRGKEVIVDTGWSDYVFDAGYKLKALSETEAYIQAEHHLPGIPSAQEVAEHGVSMGEMQSRLLAKIEELTLHAIRQEKEIQLLKEQLHLSSR